MDKVFSIGTLIFFLTAGIAQAVEFTVSMDDAKFDAWASKVCAWYWSGRKDGETEKEFALRKIQEETGMVITENRPEASDAGQ